MSDLVVEKFFQEVMAVAQRTVDNERCIDDEKGFVHRYGLESRAARVKTAHLRADEANAVAALRDAAQRMGFDADPSIANLFVAKVESLGDETFIFRCFHLAALAFSERSGKQRGIGNAALRGALESASRLGLAETLKRLSFVSIAEDDDVKKKVEGLFIAEVCETACERLASMRGDGSGARGEGIALGVIKTLSILPEREQVRLLELFVDPCDRPSVLILYRLKKVGGDPDEVSARLHGRFQRLTLGPEGHSQTLLDDRAISGIIVRVQEELMNRYVIRPLHPATARPAVPVPTSPPHQ